MHKYVFRIQIDKRDEHAVNLFRCAAEKNLTVFDVNFNVQK